MRLLAALLVLGSVLDAAAQEPPPPPPPLAVEPAPPAPPPPPPLMDAPTVSRLAPPSPDVVRRWHRARVVSVLGSVVSLIGTGLSLSSTIYIAVTDYPPSENDLLKPAKPSDTGPVLAYVGSSASAAGFVLSASGLGYQHHLLDELGADPGRGRFAVGTAFGLVGFVSIGASYFFGLTDYLNPHDQSVALLTTSIGGAALCTIASALYASDSSRMKAVWKRLTTF